MSSRNTIPDPGPGLGPKPPSFALRYHDFADGHSDLTPCPSTFPSFPLSQSSSRDWDTIEVHQKNRLHSFTTRELLNLDAISERPMAASTLSNLPILPLLRRNQWDSTGKMFGRKEAIGIDDWGQSGDGEDGKYGEWVSGNEHVWDALRPSLAIAIHELIYAMELSRNYPNRNIKMKASRLSNEPYFEDEALAELGYSYENAVDQWRIHRSNTQWNNMEKSPLGLLASDALANNGNDLTYTTSIENPQIDGEPQPPDYKYLHPIPVTVYEDVQSASFWEHAVRPYGHKILYYRTMKASVGIKVQDEYFWGRDDITGRVNVSPLRNEPKSLVDDMERLKNVTNWTPNENRGMRALVQKLKLEWRTELPHPAIHFSTILNHLELATMYLFVPDETTGLFDTEDQKEINLISQARIEYTSGHIDNCQEVIASISKNEDQSSYALTCAGLLKLACDVRSRERVWNSVDYGITTQFSARIRYLTRLCDGGKRVWIELLGNWIIFARDLMDNSDPGEGYGIWKLRMKVIEGKRKLERDIGEEAPPYPGQDI
ncbi:predicted protein [Sclerotinia sclerotiorum 1980 UF-70]|uniref:Uncharacterized protein n=2 Tax=Sclerotinia sclerotiorum (strain ATCC 18683 / 1980 / Ss-1) TaxID=665079 RepID=A7E6V7_SCLS1|nr:predicted protein [Sclerotinia sclerotiorum 1980 UF-70]APA07484.1 hypothetical protein sscle_03g022540 [Sclerotinia sclerotiorum 1980 UF-70]EDN91629.1 predicted protein [Sclerotinia sclerotiorum 1980 UF-70]